MFGIGSTVQSGYRDTETSAARFFYSSKADAGDRIGSKHPTVKPLDPMQYLCRLVTPPSGTILDPFAGTGTTGEAAWREGFKAILIEREPEYQADIARRMELAAKPAKRAAVALERTMSEPTPDKDVAIASGRLKARKSVSGSGRRTRNGSTTIRVSVWATARVPSLSMPPAC
jgi:site-specific DNA-methyltransferase (adenine-specific)